MMIRHPDNNTALTEKGTAYLMDFMLLMNEADAAALALEQSKLQLEAAKQAVETAKSSVDEAKKAYEDILSRSDELGVPRNKLKKIVDERVAALITSGLVDTPNVGEETQKAKKTVKKKSGSKKAKSEAAPIDPEFALPDAELTEDSDTDEGSQEPETTTPA